MGPVKNLSIVVHKVYLERRLDAHRMDNTYHSAPSDQSQPPLHTGGYRDITYTVNRPPPDQCAPQCDPSDSYDGHPYGFRRGYPASSHGEGNFSGSPFALSYGFDPSFPPSPFGCPPPGHFPNMVATALVNTYNSGGVSAFQLTQQLRSGPQTTLHDSNSSNSKQPREYDGFSGGGAPLGCSPFPPRGNDHDQSSEAKRRAEDEAAVQRRADQQWLGRFLQSRDKSSKIPQNQQQKCVADLRAALYRVAELVSELSVSCETLRNNVENECVWTDSYPTALMVKRDLEDKLAVLSDRGCLGSWKAKFSRVAKRTTRRLRARKLQRVEEKEREDHISEKEAAIDKWRMQQIRQVEENKKEQALKLAADAVLCEVRKKQSDVKRMQDVLRSLEKLRRLRKEAASRKGIITKQECEEVFKSRMEQLRCVLKKRTAVYSAEEKALMVMLEGEQEEERRREKEKQVKKEKERQLQRKHRMDSVLFGDELPADSVLQPFREYYTQTEHSLHALLQIRKEWDSFVVAADHPDSSPVPQSWILPEAPSDQAWASALHTTNTE